MKVRFLIILISLHMSLLLPSCNRENPAQSVHILVITGGHDFSPSFFEVFSSVPGVDIDTVSQPRANRLLTSPEKDRYDVLVFYDMWQEISDQEKVSLIRLTEQGKGMVFLHHSLVSYQHWEEFKQIIGGQYRDPEFQDTTLVKPSTYRHDILLEIKIIDRQHPVTRGLRDFSIYDEGYQNIEVLPEVHPLLSTDHPDCTPIVAWTHHYNQSRIIYILMGHGPEAHRNENYRKLVRNAILWVAGKGGAD